MPKRKIVTKEEFDNIVRERDWHPVEVVKDGLPHCFHGLPKEKIGYIAASGGHGPLPTVHGPVYGGIDVYRVAEKSDGVNFNKDHYLLVKDLDSGSDYLVVADEKGPDHWTDYIPSHLKNLEVVSMKKKGDSN